MGFVYSRILLKQRTNKYCLSCSIDLFQSTSQECKTTCRNPLSCTQIDKIFSCHTHAARSYYGTPSFKTKVTSSSDGPCLWTCFQSMHPKTFGKFILSVETALHSVFRINVFSPLDEVVFNIENSISYIIHCPHHSLVRMTRRIKPQCSAYMYLLFHC